ncbi:MAG: prephenate dehydratase [Chloroflexota bacterium]
MSWIEAEGDLSAIRHGLDEIDEQLVGLLARRFELSRRVATIKQGDARAVLAPAREAEILTRLQQLAGDALKPEHLRAIYREILAGSRDVQRRLRVAYLGPKATYGHLAAMQRFGDAAEYVPVPTNPDIVNEVERGGADYGVIPIENSTEGPVGESQDRLVDTELKVCDEVTIPIAHCLLARCPIEEVTTVYAHPQAAGQCRRWIAQNLPGRSVVHVASNGLAAERATQEQGAAGIASRLASEVFGLNILVSGIQDVAHNSTRFWVLGSRMSERPTGNDKTAIVFSIRDSVGALKRAIEAFADQGINLSSIQSRPSKRKAWDYIFFVEFGGHPNEPRVAEALDRLTSQTVHLKVLGSWPVSPAASV